MNIKSVGQLGKRYEKIWCYFPHTPWNFLVWQTKQHKNWVVNRVKTLLSLDPLQSSLQSYNLCGSTWNKYKAFLSFPTTGTYDQLNEDFLKYSGNLNTATNLPTNAKYGDEQQPQAPAVAWVSEGRSQLLVALILNVVFWFPGVFPLCPTVKQIDSIRLDSKYYKGLGNETKYDI